MDDRLGLEHGTDSKGRSWEVFEEAAGKWRWRIYDDKGDVDVLSEAVFDDMETCKNHARSNGMDKDYITLFASRTGEG